MSNFWSQKKGGTETVLLQEKNEFFKFDVANVIIGVDMKFEKGLNWGCRDNFPALLMTLSYHSLEN